MRKVTAKTLINKLVRTPFKYIGERDLPITEEEINGPMFICGIQFREQNGTHVEVSFGKKKKEGEFAWIDVEDLVAIEK
jgi:hypothetical protein